MAASGCAGLGYQIVWTQQSSLWLGHEAPAVLAVVTAFFGGLALGGLSLGARIERSDHARAWYVGCELAMALWSVVVLLVWSPFSAFVASAMGVEPSPQAQWSVAFLATFVVFLPATAAMGATLPAMERLAVALSGGGRSIAALYASNTFGAVLGVLGAAFWLVPAIGLTRTAAFCVALNLACAVLAFAVFPKTTERESIAPVALDLRGRVALLRLAATGFLGIGYEIVVVRVIGQVTENTVYTFASLLAVYLVGTAVGAAGYRRWLERRDPDGLDERLLGAVSLAVLIGAATLFAANSVRSWAEEAFGFGVGAALLAEVVLALISFGPATAAMGATFSHLSRAAAISGATFGRTVGVNTLAASAAPLIFGVVAVPALGPKLVLAAIATGYLALTVQKPWLTKAVAIPAVAALAFALVAPPLVFVDVPKGGRLVIYEEGVMAAVSVVEDAGGVATLRINNRQQEGSSATLYADARQAWLPLLLHDAPRKVLFLGLGTGVTASSAADDPTLEVDVVELLPEVIRASRHFTPDGSRRRLHVVAADARRYVRATDRRYDVIVSDNFHPARSGSGSLYTVEHFDAVRRRLEPRGVFCQWLPLHQLDLETLRSIARSFLVVYPRGVAMLATNSLETPVVGLVGRADESRFEVPAMRRRLSELAVPEKLVRLGLEDELAVFGSFVGGPSALDSFAGSAPVNTDDRPVVSYRAPGITYAPESRPRDRLVKLLFALSIQPDELVAATPEPVWSNRLLAYSAARNRFIELGRDIESSPRVEEMLARVREPLLGVLRISPDFRPAYDPLLSMATALAQTDAPRARELLAELARVQPERPEARELAMTLASDGSSVSSPR